MHVIGLCFVLGEQRKVSFQWAGLEELSREGALAFGLEIWEELLRRAGCRHSRQLSGREECAVADGEGSCTLKPVRIFRLVSPGKEPRRNFFLKKKENLE